VNSRVSEFLTISLGVGTIVPSRQEEMMGFVEMVDSRLYLAKQAGRNRMVDAD
jgi:PleD family two-component response regulator